MLTSACTIHRQNIVNMVCLSTLAKSNVPRSQFNTVPYQLQFQLQRRTGQKIQRLNEPCTRRRKACGLRWRHQRWWRPGFSLWNWQKAIDRKARRTEARQHSTRQPRCHMAVAGSLRVPRTVPYQHTLKQRWNPKQHELQTKKFKFVLKSRSICRMHWKRDRKMRETVLPPTIGLAPGSSTAIPKPESLTGAEFDLSASRMHRGFKFRWTMLFWWQYDTAWRICRM